MEDGLVSLCTGIEVIKYEDGTWILYGNDKEPLALNSSASHALDLALSYGVQEGLEQYLMEERKKYPDEKSILEAEEDYYYTLDTCRTDNFVDIKVQ